MSKIENRKSKIENRKGRHTARIRAPAGLSFPPAGRVSMVVGTPPGERRTSNGAGDRTPTPAVNGQRHTLR